jgi:hypothetical protein
MEYSETVQRVSAGNLLCTVNWNLIDYESSGAEWPVNEDFSMTVHVYGTFAGATVTLQGSNEDTPTNWVTLNNTQFQPIVQSGNSLECILENPRYIRPVHSGGLPTTDIHVVIVFRKSTY